MSSSVTTPHVHSTWNATIRTILGASLVVVLVLLAFGWPTYTAKVKDMPLGVVATSEQQAQLQQALDAADDPFELTSYPSTAEAEQAIKQREVYGAVIMPTRAGEATQVLTASAGSSAATQMLAQMAQKMTAQQMTLAVTAKQTAAQQLATTAARAAAAQASAQTLAQVQASLPAAQQKALATQLAAAQAQAKTLAAEVVKQKAAVEAITTPSVQVTDIVPLASSDSRGSGFAIAGLPLAMGGMIGGVMISMLVVGWKRRAVAVLGYGILGGLGLALVLHTWFGFVTGSFAMIWAVCGAAIAATAAFITGAQALLGQPGIALGAVLTMFVGNPISSLAMPKEWLPGAWGQIGQYFVPGAAGNLMRIESYFPDAPQLTSWLVLLGWLLVGMVLLVVGHHRDDEVIHIQGAVEAE